MYENLKFYNFNYFLYLQWADDVRTEWEFAEAAQKTQW